MDDESKLLAEYTRKLLTEKPSRYNIPVKYYPKLKQILDVMKQTAISDGQVEVVKSIHRAMAYLDTSKSAPTSPMQSSHRPKSTISVRKKKNSFQYPNTPVKQTPEELSRKIEDGYRFNPHHSDILPEIIQTQKDRIKKLIEEGKYEEADEQERLRQYTSSIVEPKRKILKNLDLKSNLLNKLTQREMKLNETIQKFKDDLNESNETKKKLIDEENERFEKEMEEFDRVTYGEIPLSHRNFSPHYLNLRKQQDFLVLTKRYGEAAKIRSIADAEEEKEMQRIRTNWLSYRKNLRITAEAEHIRKLKTIIDRREILDEKMEQKNEFSVESTRKAMNLLTDQVNSIDDISIGMDPEPYQKPQPKPVHKQPYVPRERHLIRPNQAVWNTDKNAK